MNTRKSWGIIIIRDWDFLPSQLLHSDHKIGQDCEEQQSADNDKPENLVKVPWISPPNHTDAMLVHDPAISDDPYADGSIEICKVLSNVVFGGVEKREGQCADQHSNIKIRNPCSFVGKPYFSFDLDRSCNFLGDPDLGRQRVDGVIVPSGGHVSFMVQLRIRDSIRSSVPRPDSKVFRERSKSGGREWSQHVGHGDPRASDKPSI